RAETTDRALADAFAAAIAPLAVDLAAQADVTVRLESVERLTEPDTSGMSLSWQGLLPAGFEARHYRAGASLLILLPGRACARLAPSRRRIDITVVAGMEDCLNQGAITPMLCELLAQAGHHVVHAAVLAETATDQTKAVMLVGKSGTGKTTAALALARAGLPLLTDDAAFIRRGTPSVGLSIWGLPRPCKVHRRTLGLLAWLADLPLRKALASTEEFLIDLERLPGANPKQTTRPGILLFLQPRNDHAHAAQPVDALAAIAELARQNVRAASGLATARARESFAALAQLVRASRCYRLSVGPELDRLYETVATLLRN
ncbi:MAG: hypothetical protein HQ546_02670, partial [Planctomycetes bacterium]|nr:hypothetical protein [Planctomycetota bacterium]